MENKLPVSVLITAYNAGKYIAETLNSVLQQTLQPTEIIVVNDGSTDNTKLILESFSNNIRVLSRENKGVPRSVNQAIQLSTQPLVAFLDADDLWHAEKLKIQYDFFSETPAAQILFGHVRQFISPELPEREKAGIFCSGTVEPGWLRSAMMARRIVFDEVGFFDESLTHGDFIDWFSRAKAQNIPFMMLENLVGYRRLHLGGLSGELAGQKDFARILKKRLDAIRSKTSVI